MKTYKLDLSNIEQIEENGNNPYYSESVTNSFLDLSGMIEIYYKDENDNNIYFDDTEHLLDVYQYETDIFYFESDDLQHTLKFNKILLDLVKEV